LNLRSELSLIIPSTKYDQSVSSLSAYLGDHVFQSPARSAGNVQWFGDKLT
jgi:hypothetical protein